MTHPLRRAFTPHAFERGSLARTVALVYLSLVAVAAAYSAVTLATADSADPSFSVAPLLLLTAPTSLIVAEPVGALSALFPSAGPTAAAALITSFVLGGLLQAAALFLLVRGPRRDAHRDVHEHRVVG
ncbi:SCO4225 family membrane protein [Mobilicoccus sp.]|uniref:SCO4225 family membrane protein n=1 Tax=Mobilicoccus sp. TaxID=2034349 RepID=UPI0028A9644B|nr:hypothetical protein [Mobilicoccus sp.]